MKASSTSKTPGLLIASMLFCLTSCQREFTTLREPRGETIVRGQSLYTQSSPAGNLMATALRETYDLDIVFYPSRLVDENFEAAVKSNVEGAERDRLLSLYPQGTKDQFIIGTMSGKSIREFIMERSREFFGVDVEVAGLSYHIHYIGGIRQFAEFSRPGGHRLEDDRRYKVALSEYFYFSGSTFPGYRYRNGASFRIGISQRQISARDALASFLATGRDLPDLNERRANVTTSIVGDAGEVPIHTIQGISHRSPLTGFRATTRGIVTAAAVQPWYPGGLDVYIQDPIDDGDPRTSEGLHLHIRDENTDLRLGDEILVSGVVYEDLMESGLGCTGLREITTIQRLRRDIALPEPVLLGRGGRPFPTGAISTFHGNLNQKPDLNLNEGADFWESLEGMRVRINNPRVTGYRGGLTQAVKTGPERYLDLYVVGDGDLAVPNSTSHGGVFSDRASQMYNPRIVMVSSNHLSSAVDTSLVFNVGDLIQGSVDGVMGYERNIFGGGDYALVTPQTPESISRFAESMNDRDPLPLSEKPKTQIESNARNLTVASFNVENLSGGQTQRLRLLAEAIEKNLRCPDIVNFAEIQDFNGPDFSGDADGAHTLRRIISFIHCPNVEYKYLNIDPVFHAEGGQPGGNIRVAVIYNVKKIQVIEKADPGPLVETIVLPDGNLSSNPGRLFPNDPIFRGTRKSMVSELLFNGQRILMISNHWNSKLGDASMWGAEQPPVFKSEPQRIAMASRIRSFVEVLKQRAPNAHVIVLGDFNANLGEPALSALAGDVLTNLVTLDELLPVRERYSISYNGNSQGLDYIFANDVLRARVKRLEIPHFNTDFMGQISDHDPVVAEFGF